MEFDPAHQNDRFVEVGGLRLRTSVRGRGRPLLLMNGIGASLELLDPIRRALDDVETIAFDAPGAGQSSAPCMPRRLRTVAHLVGEMLDQLGYDEVDVMGASWGGALAQEFAWRYPRRVRRLILAATSPGCLSLPPNPVQIGILATPLRYWSSSYRKTVAGILYGGEVRRNPRILREGEFYRLVIPPSLIGYLGQIAALAGWTSLPWLWRLPQPTLILAGDDDPVTPLFNSRILARLIPNSRLHVIEGGGHLALLTRASELAPVILEFLK